MSEEKLRMLRAMTPAQKLRAMLDLFEQARQSKLVALRYEHPDWTEEQIQKALRDAVLFGEL